MVAVATELFPSTEVYRTSTPNSRVIFLEEIRVGDCLNLSVAVNRAWGTSMEIGCRVMREAADTGVESYCCHGEPSNNRSLSS